MDQVKESAYSVAKPTYGLNTKKKLKISYILHSE
jgi:hypothetical protein